jgi:hypothetical protein
MEFNMQQCCREMYQSVKSVELATEVKIRTKETDVESKE